MFPHNRLAAAGCCYLHLETNASEKNTKMNIIITTSVDDVLRWVWEFPGPVFDLRSSTNGRGPKLAALAGYMSLAENDVANLLALPYILDAAHRWGSVSVVYVIGEQEAWETILAKSWEISQECANRAKIAQIRARVTTQTALWP